MDFFFKTHQQENRFGIFSPYVLNFRVGTK